ncbi:hypothetical protein AEL96_03600 [Lactobacillus crispatus]|uniref:hypothetical protein n=1 Tax=Lactobacillus crispatus TaxID=47770 RepID=UPI0007614AAF|nr:hypothetical protein [Lactobacillus crispatus]KWU06443.1 hypothetical protein AEL96_03600 [Lactobacillus crispatus]
MNQQKLFNLPFDDVNTGDQFYCEATNTTYTLVWMFTGFFNGCLLVRTHLDMPLIAQIDINLRKLSDDKWRSILKSERVTAIAECGARSEKERRLLKDFDSKGV